DEQPRVRLPLELAPQLVRPLRELDPALLGVREAEDARRAVRRASRVTELELLVDGDVLAALRKCPRRCEAYDARADDGDLHPACASTSSESFGHAWRAQSSNSRSVRSAQASPASGSTHRNVPLPPKWPNVRCELRDP